MHRHWVQSTLARRGYDNHNCHNKPQIGNVTGVWMTSCPEAMGWEFGDFEKQSVGDKMPNWEPAADRGLWALSDTRLSNPAKMRKKYCWDNIAVCPRPQLISHTQPTSTLSRIKCERYIFIKKCLRSFIEVRILSIGYIPHIFVYVCGYITHVNIYKNIYKAILTVLRSFFLTWGVFASQFEEYILPLSALDNRSQEFHIWWFRDFF